MNRMDQDHQPPRELEVYTPRILSTRHPGGTVRSDVSNSVLEGSACCHSENKMTIRVPFSWEEAPGKPRDDLMRSKDIIDHNNNHVSVEGESLHKFSLPKPPPIKVFHAAAAATDHTYNFNYAAGVCYDDSNNSRSSSDHESVSGRELLDLFSLGDQSDEKGVGHGSSSNSGESPTSPPLNFMMERFLPAAVALAASSSTIAPYPVTPTARDGKHFRGGCDIVDGYERGCMPRRVLRSSSPPSPWWTVLKGCGLDVFLSPWRARHKICGVKDRLY